MKKEQFIKVLETKAEMLVEHQDTRVGAFGLIQGVTVSEYAIECVARRGWGLDECEILLDVPLDLGMSDTDGCATVVVVKLSDTVAAVFDVTYPVYCDNEADGDGVLTVYEWRAESAVVGMKGLLRDQRETVTRAYLGPLITHRDQLFGSEHWAVGFAKAVADVTPAEDRLAGLRLLTEEFQRQLALEAHRRIQQEAPRLARVALEHTSEYNDEGGYFMSLNYVTLALVSGESLYFNGDENLDYGCAFQLEEFAAEILADLGVEFDWEAYGHKEAFFLWMECRLGAADFEQFWSALWGWIESNAELSSFSFQAVETSS